MGAFFTNVHVRSADGDAHATRTAILDAIARLVTEKGFVPCDEGDKPDRSIVVGPAGPWIGVFDESTESQDVNLLDALAKALSTATSRPALAALVHDSDHLLIRLFEAGAIVDEVDREKKKGKLDAWSGVVAPDKAESLRKAFVGRDLMAEQTLADIAEILGIGLESACNGYKYLLEQPLPEGATHLCFRHAERPAYERPAEGPPRIASFGIKISRPLAVGGDLGISYITNNGGGAVHNFYVAVHGPAVEAGLVQVDKVRLYTGLGQRKRGTSFEATAERRTTGEGKPALVADFPEGDLPASNAGGPQALAGVGASERMEISMRSNISVTIQGSAVALGEGDLFVSIVPREARENAGHAVFHVAVAPPARKPLRGKAMDPTHYLPLSTPDALVGLAVSTLDKGQAASIAAEVVERWSELWPAETKLKATIFEGSLARATKPRTATLTVGKLAKSAPWKKLRAALTTANAISAEADVEPVPGERLRSGNGFAFGGSLVASPVQIPDDGELPTLRLVVTLRGRSDIEDVVHRARAVVDDFVQRARCCQAILMRCSPGSVTVLDHSTYEDVCGLHGQITLYRSWCSRFLRGVGADGMWLGPDLLSRVDRGALKELCDIETVGDTARIVLREGATLDALEQALAPLLASEQDWHEAAHRRSAAMRALISSSGGGLPS
jgi:hypothetical protein